MNKKFEDKLKQCSYEELNELYKYIGKLKAKINKREKAKKWYENHKQFYREYYKKNSEKLKEYRRKYGKEHYNKRIMEEKQNNGTNNKI